MSSNTGNLIRKYRKKRGLTQKQLGDLCGIADSNIRKYESGKQNPKIETLEKIADALDVHPLVLLDRITDEFATSLSVAYAPGEIFSSLFNYMYGGIELQKNTLDNVKHLELNYVLGADKDIVISDLTYDNISESIERLVRISVDFAVKYNSQEPFSLLHDLEKADLHIWKMIHEYAIFLINKENSPNQSGNN